MLSLLYGDGRVGDDVEDSGQMAVGTGEEGADVVGAHASHDGTHHLTVVVEDITERVDSRLGPPGLDGDDDKVGPADGLGVVVGDGQGRALLLQLLKFAVRDVRDGDVVLGMLGETAGHGSADIAGSYDGDIHCGNGLWG